MAAAVVQEPEAPEVARITQVEDLPDPVRADIVARRQAGETLAELKTRFAHVDPAVIREVLPPANQRERKAREAKQPKEAKVTESKQGIGGRSGEAKSEPKPKTEPKPRYAEGEQVIKLAERALAARQVMGRNALAEALDMTGSAVWRFENGRIHPTEVESLTAGLKKVEDRIAAGEFVKAERQPKVAGPSKAELAHRVEEAVKYLRGGTSGSGKSVAQAVLAILDPPGRP